MSHIFPQIQGTTDTGGKFIAALFFGKTEYIKLMQKELGSISSRCHKGNYWSSIKAVQKYKIDEEKLLFFYIMHTQSILIDLPVFELLKKYF